MNTSEIQRKALVLWLTARIRFHRAIMDAEGGVTDNWKQHARKFVRLCKYRSEIMTLDDRYLLRSGEESL